MKQKKQRKQAIPVVKDTVGVAVRVVLQILYVVLAYLFCMDYEVTLLAGLSLLAAVIGGGYWALRKRALATNRHMADTCRFIVAYVTTLLAVFFYSLAMYRSDQLNDISKAIIIIASLFVFYCIRTATKGMFIKK